MGFGWVACPRLRGHVLKPGPRRHMPTKTWACHPGPDLPLPRALLRPGPAPARPLLPTVPVGMPSATLRVGLFGRAEGGPRSGRDGLPTEDRGDERVRFAIPPNRQ